MASVLSHKLIMVRFQLRLVMLRKETPWMHQSSDAKQRFYLVCRLIGCKLRLGYIISAYQLLKAISRRQRTNSWNLCQDRTCNYRRIIIAKISPICLRDQQSWSWGGTHWETDVEKTFSFWISTTWCALSGFFPVSVQMDVIHPPFMIDFSG